MAYSTISKPSLHFNTKLYTGNGSGNQAVTGVGFQPDFVWTKNRASAYGHNLYNSASGVGKYLASNSTAAEQTSATSIISFDSDGFTVGTGDNVQYESANGVSWNWKAGGAGSANTDGSINSTVSANTTAGFSIVKFVGNSTSGATVGHGLGVAPKVVIIKSRDTGYSWRSYFAPIGATKYLELDANAVAVTASNFMNNTAPTSTVFSLGNGDTPNKNGDNYIAYCFANITGYSKFGSFTGNGIADGPFVYTGFKPAFVLTKTATSTYHWNINDNKRNTFNPSDKRLYPSQNNAEATNAAYNIDFLSNGFKIRSNSVSWNQIGDNVIYMAFAEEPLVANSGTSGVPSTAR